MVCEEFDVERKGAGARGGEKWSIKQYSVFPTQRGHPELSLTSDGCERRKPWYYSKWPRCLTTVFDLSWHWSRVVFELVSSSLNKVNIPQLAWTSPLPVPPSALSNRRVARFLSVF